MKKIFLAIGFLSLLLTPFAASATTTYVGSCAAHNYTIDAASCSVGISSGSPLDVAVGDIVVVGYAFADTTDQPYTTITDNGGNPGSSNTFVGGNYFNVSHNYAPAGNVYGTQFIISYNSLRSGNITYTITRPAGNYNVTDIHVYVYRQTGVNQSPHVDQGTGLAISPSLDLVTTAFGTFGSTESITFGLAAHGFTLDTPIAIADCTFPGSGTLPDVTLAPGGYGESVSWSKISTSYNSKCARASISPSAYTWAISGLVIYFTAGAATTTTTTTIATTTTTSTTTTTGAGTTTTTTTTTTTITIAAAPPCSEVLEGGVLVDCNNILFNNMAYNLQGSIGDSIGPVQGNVLFNSGPLASSGSSNTGIAYSITTSGTPGYRATLRYFDAYCAAGTATVTIKDGATTVWTTKTGAVGTSVFQMPFPILTGTANNDMQISLGTCGGTDIGHLQVIGDTSP